MKFDFMQEQNEDREKADAKGTSLANNFATQIMNEQQAQPLPNQQSQQEQQPM
jgi:hypothetical protein